MEIFHHKILSKNIFVKKYTSVYIYKSTFKKALTNTKYLQMEVQQELQYEINTYSTES